MGCGVSSESGRSAGKPRRSTPVFDIATGTRVKKPKVRWQKALIKTKTQINLVPRLSLTAEDAQEAWKNRDQPSAPPPRAEKHKFVILSFDGGGMRGMIHCVVMERLSALFPGLIDHFDLVAGTSAGSLFLWPTVMGKTPEEGLELVKTALPHIYSKNTQGITNAKYNSVHGYLTKRLEDIDVPLREVKKKIVIPVFAVHADEETGCWQPRIYHNYPDSKYLDVKMSLAVSQSTAAPTYFPALDGCADGGIVANNPSMCAVMEALRHGIDLSDIVVVSIGTGVSHNSVPNESDGNLLDWGLKQWGPSMVKLMTDGSTAMPDLMCREIIGKNYCRINPVLSRRFALDSKNPQDVKDIVEEARAMDLSSAAQFVRERVIAERTLLDKTIDMAVFRSAAGVEVGQ